MQKRLCKRCFDQRVFVEFEIDRLCRRYPRIDDTLLCSWYIRYTLAQYTYTGDTTRPEWAGRKPIYQGYDIKAVRARVQELDQLPESERASAMENMFEEQKEKMAAPRKCEKHFLSSVATVKRMG